jgi:hypothetical protein
MSDLERFVTELQRYGVSFWLEGDQLKWHSVAALRLAQVISITKNRDAIAEIIRAQRAAA